MRPPFYIIFCCDEIILKYPIVLCPERLTRSIRSTVNSILLPHWFLNEESPVDL